MDFDFDFLAWKQLYEKYRFKIFTYINSPNKSTIPSLKQDKWIHFAQQKHSSLINKIKFLLNHSRAITKLKSLGIHQTRKINSPHEWTIKSFNFVQKNRRILKNFAMFFFEWKIKNFYPKWVRNIWRIFKIILFSEAKAKIIIVIICRFFNRSRYF